MESLNEWKGLMREHDKRLYKRFLGLSKEEINTIRERYKLLRITALWGVNKNFRKEGREGRLSGMEMSDDSLMGHLENKLEFFELSRILDFDMGFTPIKD